MATAADLGITEEEFEAAVNLEKIFSLVAKNDCNLCGSKPVTHASLSPHKLLCDSCGRNQNGKKIGEYTFKTYDIEQLENSTRSGGGGGGGGGGRGESYREPARNFSPPPRERSPPPRAERGRSPRSKRSSSRRSSRRRRSPSPSSSSYSESESSPPPKRRSKSKSKSRGRRPSSTPAFYDDPFGSPPMQHHQSAFLGVGSGPAGMRGVAMNRQRQMNEMQHMNHYQTPPRHIMYQQPSYSSPHRQFMPPQQRTAVNPFHALPTPAVPSNNPFLLRMGVRSASHSPPNYYAPPMYNQYSSPQGYY